MGHSSFDPFSLPYRSALSNHIAQKVFDVLIKYKLESGSKTSKKLFIALQTNPKNICIEYTFLSHNGKKFYNANRKFYVTSSGLSPESKNVKEANKALEKIYRKHIEHVARERGLID
jgi:hypothetical protein